MDKDKIFKMLTKKIPEEQVFIDEPMKNHTSFRIGGLADILVKVKDIEELKFAIKISKSEKIDITFIGNGSNILVKDNGIRGIVVKLELCYISIENDLVTVGSGVKIGALSQTLLQEGLSGFEFAYGIPGTIGGAIKMNAGAYGGEMKDVVVETKCLNLEDYSGYTEVTNIDDIEIENYVEGNESSNPNIIILNNDEQKFSYRHSIFMEKKYVIIETKLKFIHADKEKIKETMQNHIESRKEKQPLDFPSAGSTFKRREDYITSKLIDDCGLKGYQIGGAQVSEKHAGFIINKNDATAQDVIDLIDYVKKVVYEKTGKQIELEIEIVGE